MITTPVCVHCGREFDSPGERAAGTCKACHGYCLTVDRAIEILNRDRFDSGVPPSVIAADERHYEEVTAIWNAYCSAAGSAADAVRAADAVQQRVTDAYRVAAGNCTAQRPARNVRQW